MGRQNTPIRYEALEICLNKTYEKAFTNKLTISSPRLGCVLAGGSWDRIEAIIKKTMTVDTYIYTLESQKDRWPTKYENVDDLKDGAQRKGDLPGNGVDGDVSDEDLAKYFK